MEEAPGTKLEDVWNGKTITGKTSIVKGLVEIEKKLLSVSFTRGKPTGLSDSDS
ncbi:hypothetical protein OCU04_000412 [Sclerotinia nivalis]|uniref:Uncharacterized protein n=1 Tax=Sclerotinia nivalis TaxID=352851 RepID=A0A9X0DNQ7_9HELO|nr:hypothetical protein OCU04_000412 [Sclerotinia nivalis]